MEKTYRTKRPPYGFRFLDPENTHNLEKTRRKIQDLLNEEKYQPVTPATIDFPETFETYESYSSFRFRDSLGEDLWLRSDATVQVMKGFANLIERTSTQKTEANYYYFLPVFRDIRKNYPKNREVYQVGVESIGQSAEQCVPNLLVIVDKIMKSIFKRECKILLGDVAIFNYISDVWANENLKEICLKRDVPALNEALISLGWSEDSAHEISCLLLIPPSLGVWKQRWKNLKTIIKNPDQRAVAEQIEIKCEKLITLTEKMSELSIEVSWEPLLIRNVNYYTGFIFEGYVSGSPQALLRGGSYDNLVSKYANMDLPASGFAMDVSSLITL